MFVGILVLLNSEGSFVIVINIQNVFYSTQKATNKTEVYKVKTTLNSQHRDNTKRKKLGKFLNKYKIQETNWRVAWRRPQTLSALFAYHSLK